MSSDSLALFRKSMGNELGALAEVHCYLLHTNNTAATLPARASASRITALTSSILTTLHSLQASDRTALQSAASRLSTHTTIGSVLGFSLGLFAAIRLRRNRTAMFNAFRASEKPTSVQFANGRTENLPDLTPMLKPSTLGDVATYSLFGLAGLFVGGETGLLTGGLSAQSAIKKDPEAKKRIETAFRKFRAETLRLEADQLEKGEKALGL
ncbi:hypothetical protein E4T45_02636 [Aureobasidium sp. EXF-8846]|nr:hypothetical protein E4T45_02636 [Aureobasidium sp. EXF-8846]